MEVKTGYTLIKHYYSHQFDDLAHNKVTFDVAEDASLDQMLDAFEHFLKASGFSFDGQLDFVKDEDEPLPHPPRWAAKSDLMSTFDEKM